MSPRLRECMNCDPSYLLEVSTCFTSCFTDDDLRAMELAILNSRTGLGLTIDQIIENAKCLKPCVDAGLTDAISVWMIADIAGSSKDPATLLESSGCIGSCLVPSQLIGINVYIWQKLTSAVLALTPQELLDLAACFRHCVDPWLYDAVKMYLLSQIAVESSDPQTMVSNASCLAGCLTQEQLKLIETRLLCSWLP